MIDLDRYSRQIILRDFGEDGQKRLSQASALLVGVGGLGSPIALYLIAAGISRLGIMDDDRVSISNLQRQVLFDSGETGMPKVEAAVRRLNALNPEVEVLPYFERFTQENALRLAAGYDLLIGATDNYESRYLLNDTAIQLAKPFVHGSISQFEGQVSVFYAPQGPCYRCLYPETPKALPTGAERGVLGALPGIVGSVQALETIKWIVRGNSSRSVLESLLGRVWLIDAATMESRTLKLAKRPGCLGCSLNRESPS